MASPGRPRAFDAEQQAQIRRLRAEGVSLQRIAAQVGGSHASVARFLKSYPKPHTPKSQIVSLRGGGMGTALVGMLPELRMLRGRLKEALEAETDGGRVAQISAEMRKVLVEIDRAEAAERALAAAPAAQATDATDELAAAIERLAAASGAERTG